MHNTVIEGDVTCTDTFDYIPDYRILKYSTIFQMGIERWDLQFPQREPSSEGSTGSTKRDKSGSDNEGATFQVNTTATGSGLTDYNPDNETRQSDTGKLHLDTHRGVTLTPLVERDWYFSVIPQSHINYEQGINATYRTNFGVCHYETRTNDGNHFLISFLSLWKFDNNLTPVRDDNIPRFSLELIWSDQPYDETELPLWSLPNPVFQLLWFSDAVLPGSGVQPYGTHELNRDLEDDTEQSCLEVQAEYVRKLNEAGEDIFPATR